MQKAITLTKEGKASLEAELQELIAGRAEIKEKITTARAFGDLSENEDYSAARNEQKLAESRILEIEDILKNARIVRSGSRETVSLGATVVVKVSGKEFTYSIVSPVEADPLAGKISDVSPVGKALIGKKAGEEYTLPNGKKGSIVSIS